MENMYRNALVNVLKNAVRTLFHEPQSFLNNSHLYIFQFVIKIQQRINLASIPYN